MLEETLKGIPFLIPTGYPSIKTLESKFQLRDYQKEAYIKAINYGSGVIELATGGGKTFIIANVAYTALQLLQSNERVLISVPDIGLVGQTYKDFTDYGFPMETVTKWTGTHEINLSARVVIANLGILQSKKSDLSWFKEVGMLIVDECHKLRHGNKVNKLLNKIPTHRCIGFPVMYR